MFQCITIKDWFIPAWFLSSRLFRSASLTGCKKNNQNAEQRSQRRSIGSMGQDMVQINLANYCTCAIVKITTLLPVETIPTRWGLVYSNFFAKKLKARFVVEQGPTCVGRRFAAALTRADFYATVTPKFPFFAQFMITEWTFAYQNQLALSHQSHRHHSIPRVGDQRTF